MIRDADVETNLRADQFNDVLLIVFQCNSALVRSETTYINANGNQARVTNCGVTSVYTWSPKDRLISIAQGTAPPTSIFEYDSRDRRTAKTTGGTTTKYIWDGIHIAAETNAIGNTLAHYSWLYDQVQGEVRGTQAKYFDSDASNSLILTTNPDGTVPGRIAYRPYGEIRSTTGNTTAPFRFNAYVDDGGAGIAGMLSSPSRYFNSSSGRFLSHDMAKPDQHNPLSYNPYLGMFANPMTFADPNGQYPPSGVVSEVCTKPSIFMRAFFLSRATQFILQISRFLVVSFENPTQNLSS
jgi:RHS repeat-associated protein